MSEDAEKTELEAETATPDSLKLKRPGANARLRAAISISLS